MDRLEASDQAMTNAIKRGLPAKWFAACKELADEAQVECDPKLFGMVGFNSDEAPTDGENKGEAA